MRADASGTSGVHRHGMVAGRDNDDEILHLCYVCGLCAHAYICARVWAYGRQAEVVQYLGSVQAGAYPGKGEGFRGLPTLIFEKTQGPQNAFTAISVQDSANCTVLCELLGFSGP